MSTGPSPTARALQTLELLHDRPYTTAGQLATALGVTERAARRYIGILREAGIPVVTTRGTYGGYHLGRGTRMPPVRFTEEQALSLVIAVLDGQPAALDSDDLIDAALTKVIRALPDSISRQAAALRAHVSSASVRPPTRPHTTTMTTLVAAVADHRRTAITYRPEDGDQWAAEVDPWAVIVRYGRWYLLCHSHRADAIRTYRVDRIGTARHLPDVFAPPDDLDAVAVLEENLAAGWKYATRVRFQAPHPDVAPWIRPPMGRLEPAGDGCVLVGTTRNPAMYAQEWLASVPFDFVVEGGAELRAAVATVAARFSAALGPTT